MPVPTFRINRIRLEFKGKSQYSMFIVTKVLIESDWNLKKVRRFLEKK